MNIFTYLIKYQNNILKRDWLIDLLTICSRTVIDITDPPDGLYEGQIVLIDDQICGITSIDPIEYEVLSTTKDKALLGIYDKFTLQPGDIANNDKKIETTVGRFILNYTLLAQPFGDIFPYINSQTKVSKIEDMIVQAGLSNKITVSQVKEGYLTNLYYIGHFTELWVPSYSDAAIIPNPIVIKRRDELIEKYKDQMDDPIIMTKIEDELIALLKEQLKDDPSYGFYGVKSKSLDTCIKRMMIAGGVVQYEENGEVKYTFVKNSLDDEWDKNMMHIYCNEVRKGIHGRSVKTAEGGTIVKQILRQFQDTVVLSGDCGTKKTYDVVLTEENKEALMHANIVTPNGIVSLKDDIVDKYLGKKIRLRSPLYCKAKNGFCEVCMGDLMKIRDTKYVATIVSRVGSAFLSNSMKLVHGTKYSVLNVSDLNEFVVQS